MAGSEPGLPRPPGAASLLADALARVRREPLRLIGGQLLVAVPVIASLLLFAAASGAAAEAWLAPERPGAPGWVWIALSASAAIYLGAHLVLRPPIEAAIARACLDADAVSEAAEASVWSRAWRVQLERWFLPWLLFLLPIAGSATALVSLAARGALDAGPLLAIVSIGGGSLVAGAAAGLWLHLRAATAFAALSSQPRSARASLHASAAVFRARRATAVASWLMLSGLLLGAAWLAAELPHRLAGSPSIALLSEADLRLRIPGLVVLQQQIFIASSLTSALIRALASAAWSRHFARTQAELRSRSRSDLTGTQEKAKTHEI